MFEHSLIDLEEKQHPRRRWGPLPVAVGLHVVVLACVALAQVWTVEAVGEPQIVQPFITVSLPPPPAPLAGSSRPVTPAPRPVTPQTPVQPDIDRVPDTPSDAPSESSAGPVLEGASSTGSAEGVAGGVDFGIPGGDPASRSTGGIGWGGPVVEPEPRNEIVRFDGTMTRPAQLSGRQPRYTEVARRAGVQGTVILEAVIDKKGRVSNVRVLKGLPMGLDAEAVSAVQEWRFEPARIGSQPVAVYYTLTVNFQIQR
jgi:periplasmic protein TonB